MVATGMERAIASPLAIQTRLRLPPDPTVGLNGRMASSIHPAGVRARSADMRMPANVGRRETSAFGWLAKHMSDAKQRQIDAQPLRWRGVQAKGRRRRGNHCACIASCLGHSRCAVPLYE